MASSIKQRLAAGAVHLGISSLIALSAVALIFWVWYPPPFSEAQGVNHLVLILIAVDVTVGPLITTIVYNRAKKSLRFDLCVIAVLQLTALLYGLHAIFAGRPVYLVFNVDRFDLVPALDIDTASYEQARLQGAPRLPWWGPRTTAARAPEDQKERTALMFSSGAGGPDLPQLPAYYVPYANERETVLKRVRPLSELREANHINDANWTALLSSFRRSENELRYLPMRAKAKDGAVIVDAVSAEIVDIVLLNPRWD